jgi:uncharacterized membrane protein
MKVQNHFWKTVGKAAKTGVILLWFITIALLISSAVVASTVKEVAIIDKIYQDGSLKESIFITLENNTNSLFPITLPTNAKNIIVNGKAESPVNNSIKIPISCISCSINIGYTLDSNIKNGANDLHSFYRSVNFPIIPDKFRYVIYLPIGYTLGNNTEQASVVPYPSEITSDGESVILIWSENKPKLPMQFVVQYYGHESGENTADVIADFAHTLIWMTVLFVFIIGFVLGDVFERIIAGRKLRKNKKLYQQTAETVPSYLLSPDEKAVVEFLKGKKKDDFVNQKEIGKALSWSKSKVSAVISNLSYKKMIERDKVGRNYTIKLIKDIE